ncbi:RHS repeat domain-containing protein [Pseudomonas corrugata]
MQLKGHARAQQILLDAHYNAAGQVERQDTANGVITRWTYDPANDLLSTVKTGKTDAALCQNLAYFYDPVGNVLRIDDLSVATVYCANQRVDGHRDFTYDSLYRLASASGLEGDIPHLQPGLPQLFIPIDPGRRFNYTQFYDYDTGNNLTRLRHVRTGNNHTQTLRISPTATGEYAGPKATLSRFSRRCSMLMVTSCIYNAAHSLWCGMPATNSVRSHCLNATTVCPTMRKHTSIARVNGSARPAPAQALATRHATCQALKSAWPPTAKNCT